MNRDEYRAWIREYAPSIGLDPALAESVWKQESGGSLDTGLRGPELSRGRGAAVGPWQVVPAYHPEFPVSGDPVEQGKYAMNYLKDVGPARYYGTGKAPEGHPTTAQYVNQVMARAGRPDVRMAGGDPAQMVPGDPMSGTMNLPPFPAAAPQAPQDSFADSLKPLIGLLAGYAGGRGSTQERIGGAGLAAGSMQVAENELLDLKQKRADAMRRRQGQDSLDRYAAMLSANPETADIGAAMMVDPGAGMQMYAQRQQAQAKQQAWEAHARQLKDAGATDYQVAQAMAGQNPGQQVQPPGPAQFGLAPRQYVVGDKVMERVYASDGSFVDREMPGTPIAYDEETARNVASGRASGAAKGATEEKTLEGMKTLTTLFDEIQQTLPQATGSGIGTLYDSALAFFGASSPGAEAADKMRVLGARLVQTVPRMEGPQSDRDVEMYRQAAGALQDSTLPAARRAAALDTIMTVARNQQALGNPVFAKIKLPGSPAAGSGADPLGWRK